MNSGNCPKCAFEAMEYKMIINISDYWECPNCHLQIQLVGDNYLGILNEKGNGKFKGVELNPKRFFANKKFLRQPLFDGDKCVLKGENDLANHLSYIFNK